MLVVWAILKSFFTSNNYSWFISHKCNLFLFMHNKAPFHIETIICRSVYSHKNDMRMRRQSYPIVLVLFRHLSDASVDLFHELSARRRRRFVELPFGRRFFHSSAAVPHQEDNDAGNDKRSRNWPADDARERRRADAAGGGRRERIYNGEEMWVITVIWWICNNCVLVEDEFRLDVRERRANRGKRKWFGLSIINGNCLSDW